ncbi:phosphoribosylanthranilate isomerase [Sinosporangium album]|uniref:N-(5'-phosphoribosyl)anthranilate isomerase n=2 Tax=Sinosporangium album TaxID=504805 RepID=A0A1G8JHD8_9ACTN|nr:phosphoribosylanthranilate isomerase [Sinosporangium album]
MAIGHPLDRAAVNDWNPLTSLFVKVCGLRTERDVDTAVEAGADAIGFVFAESPRQVDADTARRLVRRVPEHVLTVAVFRNQSLGEVRALSSAAGVGAVQLHGSEGRDYYDILRQDDVVLIRGAAFREPIPQYGDMGEDMLLLDAPTPGAGVPWNWAQFGSSTDKWLLAGGLTPDNVGEAIAATKPFGVDVSSGVEVSRGVKDPALITSFIKAARAQV